MPTILERSITACQLSSLLVLLAACSCGHQDKSGKVATSDPGDAYQRIQELRHKNAPAALAEAEKAYRANQDKADSSVAAYRLRLLYAHILIEREHYDAVDSLLSFDTRNEEIRTRQLAAIAYLFFRHGRLEVSKRISAFVLSDSHVVRDDCWNAEFLDHYSTTLVYLEDRRGQTVLDQAEGATDHCTDQYWTAYRHLIWGNLYASRFRYEQELDEASKAFQVANKYQFTQLTPQTSGNIALAYVHLGDFDGALSKLDQAEHLYSPNDKANIALDVLHRARAHRLRNNTGDSEDAIHDYKQALDILKDSKKDPIYQRSLAELTTILIEGGRLNEAEALNVEALKTASSSTERWTQLSALLNESAIARLRAHFGTSLQEGRSLARLFRQEGESDPELNSRLHSEMAQTLDAMGRQSEADREYQIAVDTADKARKSLDDTWSQMTFSVYLQKLVALYIDSQVKRGDAPGSLQIAETFRAQSMSEKLHSKVKPAPEQFRKIAAARNAVILSYWINGDRSYLWATTAKEIKVFALQGMRTLENELNDLDNDIRNHVDLLPRPKPYIELYKKLVKPAEGMIARDANVIIVPDGELARLNFELLIPDTPNKPAGYWINQVSTMAVAPSLALLQNESTPPKDLQHAFLVGDPIVKDTEPELSEIEYIKPLFPDPEALTKEQATTQQFIDKKPGEFAVLHISAHAFGNKTSPLDSFIELTNGRLYAHDLQGLRLKEDLVTLSACQGAKGRSLPGEGVVSLTWAILSAGAHTVIATAPNVPVYTTRQFMKDFYTQLKRGDTAARALHSTKVDLIKKQPAPYYWAGFQLYTR